jgi:hypothetical protein
LFFRVVRQVQPETALDLRPVFRFDVLRSACQVVEFLDNGDDLLLVEVGRTVGVLFGWRVLVVLGASAVGLGFGDPVGDDDGGSGSASGAAR